MEPFLTRPGSNKEDMAAKLLVWNLWLVRSQPVGNEYSRAGAFFHTAMHRCKANSFACLPGLSGNNPTKGSLDGHVSVLFTY